MPFFNCYFLIRDATNQTVEKVGKRITISFAVAKGKNLENSLNLHSEWMWLLYFLTPSCIPKTEQRNTSIKKTTVCHHRVGCARLSDVGHVARKVEVAGKNRKETAISLLSPCAFFLTYSPGDEVDFTALLHYYLGAWNRLVIRLLFVNQARFLTRLIWLFHVTYDYRAPPHPPIPPPPPNSLGCGQLGN